MKQHSNLSASYVDYSKKTRPMSARTLCSVFTFVVISALLSAFAVAAPGSAQTLSYTGSAAAAHMELKDPNGKVVCKVYNTSANTKPVANGCPAGTWTEQLFDSNWKQIGKNRTVNVGATSNPRPDDSGSEGTSKKSLDGAAAQRYWTSSKMEAATDVLTGEAVLTRSARAASQPPVSTSIPSSMRQRTGRLFFTVPSLGDSSCTASVVNTAGKDTVWTAGHCVHLNGEWATNVIFVPGYDKGKEPYGRWSARQLWSLYGWTKGGQEVNSCGVEFTGGDLRYDLGVVILNPRGGRHIVEQLGGNGIRFNPSLSSVSTYAYDGTTGANNDGCDGSVAASEKLLIGCSSRVSNPGNRPGMFAVSCSELGPGSSGGGIFQAGSGGPYLVGITSHSDSRYPGYHYSPVFGQGAINLHNATKNL